MHTQVIDLDDAHFEDTVQPINHLLWLDFWGENCLACEEVAGWIDRLPERFASHLTIGKINVYQNEGLIKRFGVTRIPTFIFLANGLEKHRQTAQLAEAELHHLLDSLLETRT